jgi:hypothetical protein
MSTTREPTPRKTFTAGAGAAQTRAPAEKITAADLPPSSVALAFNVTCAPFNASSNCSVRTSLSGTTAASPADRWKANAAGLVVPLLSAQESLSCARPEQQPDLLPVRAKQWTAFLTGSVNLLPQLREREWLSVVQPSAQPSPCCRQNPPAFEDKQRHANQWLAVTHKTPAAKPPAPKSAAGLGPTRPARLYLVCRWVHNERSPGVAPYRIRQSVHPDICLRWF